MRAEGWARRLRPLRTEIAPRKPSHTASAARMRKIRSIRRRFGVVSTLGSLGTLLF